MHAISAERPLTPAEAGVLLAGLPAVVERGLTPEELEATEARWGFRFAAEHRTLLAAGLPVGPSWPDWRHGSEEELAGRLGWPVEGVLFDVEHAGFWHPDWGSRPEQAAAAVALARVRLREVPVMVPVFGHRYLPAADAAPSGHPVLSMHQTDIIVYGSDLADYLDREFRTGCTTESPAVTVPFWRDFLDSGQTPSNARRA
jgi:hypothetical protein